jgi:hypothetical protein
VVAGLHRVAEVGELIHARGSCGLQKQKLAGVEEPCGSKTPLSRRSAAAPSA